MSEAVLVKTTFSNIVSTPMDLNVKLVKDDGYSKKVDTIQYQSMLGSLLHAARIRYSE